MFTSTTRSRAVRFTNELANRLTGWAAISVLTVLVIALIISVALFELLPAALRGRFSRKGPDVVDPEPKTDTKVVLYNNHLLL